VSKISIVAEIGSNFAKFDDPDENLNCAIEQVIAAFECGATAVKFQYFTAHDLFGPDVPKDKSEQLESFVPRSEDIKTLSNLCKEVGIEFQCSAFSVLGFEYVNKFVDRHKLASPEYTDSSLRKWLQSCGKPVIYSLGCHAGYVFETEGNDVYLECVSRYPAGFLDYDLGRMVRLPNWGVSDHTINNDLAIYARTLGASFFEKHVDFFYGEGRATPDECVSITGEEFVQYVHAINSVEPMDRDQIKYESAKSYARRKGAGETYYRPMPEGWQ
jgi:N-acetylneuraminate synthase